jgi:hypothetical protein
VVGSEGAYRPLILAAWRGLAGEVVQSGYWRSLADAAVDAFSQQVGVAAVAGVLLDHVDQHFTQRDLRAVRHGAFCAEVGGASDERFGEVVSTAGLFDLTSPTRRRPATSSRNPALASGVGLSVYYIALAGTSPDHPVHPPQTARPPSRQDWQKPGGGVRDGGVT